MKARRVISVLAGMLVCASLAIGQACAATVTYGVVGGDLGVGSNWSSGSLPGTGDAAFVLATGTTLGSPTALSVEEFDIGNGDGVTNTPQGTTGSVTMNGGSVTAANWLLIGRCGGVGSLNQSGGTVTVNNGNGQVGIGWQWQGSTSYSSTGTYTLSGNGVLNANNNSIVVGNAIGDVGVINLNGGTINAGGNAWFGNTNSGGTLNMSGGVFNLGGSLWLGHPNGGGQGGTGILNFTGGTINTNYLGMANSTASNCVGVGSGTIGTSAVLNSKTWVEVSFGGSGSSGASGNLTVNGTLNVNTAGGGNLVMGDYDTCNGTLTINTGATVRVENNAQIAYSYDPGGWSGAQNNGNQVINQNGGLVVFYSDSGATVGGTGYLNMNRHSGTGTYAYYLSGGTLQTPRVGADTTNGTQNFYFNGGTLKATGATTTFISNVGNVYVQSHGAIIDDSGYNVTIPQALLGDPTSTGGSLTKQGQGQLTLAGNNTYTGTTTVAGGVLNINGGDSSTGMVVSGGSLYVNASSPATTVSVAGGATLGGSGSLWSATANVANGGALDFSRNAGSTFYLGNLNYAGSGTLNIGALANYVYSPALSTGALTTSGSININANLGAVSVLSGTYDLAGFSSIAGAGTSAFHLYVNGLSNRQGASLVDVNNQLEAVISGQTPFWSGNQPDWRSNNAWTLQPSGASATFQTGDADIFDDTAGTGTYGGAVALNSSNVAPSSVTFNNTGLAYTVSGNYGITGSASLAIQGGGSVTLLNSNSYTGATSVINGTLQLGNGGATGSLSASSAIALGGNGVLTFSRSNSAVQGVDFGPINGAGSLVQMGPGALILNASNGYSGGTTLNNGMLALNNNNAISSGTLTINGGTLDSTVAGVTLPNNVQNWNGDFTFNGTQSLNLGAGAVALGGNRTVTVNANTLTVGGNISDSGFGYGLTLAGSGNLTLTGSNAYAGGTTINGGTLQIGNGGTTLSLPAGTTGAQANSVVNNGALVFNVNANVTASNDISGTGSVTVGGGNRLHFSGNNTYSGPTTINAGSVLEVNSTASYSQYSDYTVNGTMESYNNLPSVTIGALSGSGAVYNTGSSSGTTTLTVGANNDSGTFFGTIANGAWGSNVTALTVSGTGVQVLSGTNTYSGPTTISGGTLQLGTGQSGQDGSIAATSGVTNNAMLVYNLSGSQSAGYAISGTGGLTKRGQGHLTLTGGNTYSGNTTVNAGELYVNGSLASAVTVNGGTLGGSGTAPAANVAAGGGIEGGYNGTGTLTLGSLAYAGSGTFTTNGYANYPASGSAAPLSVSGSNGLNTTGAGSVTVDLAGPFALSAGTYHAIQYSGAIGGSGSAAFVLGTVANNPRGQLGFRLVNDPGYVDVAVSVTPVIWTGSLSTAWNATDTLPAPKNWSYAGSGTNFLAGDIVQFDNSTASGGTINISNGNVLPSAVVFNNDVGHAYTLTGTNGISGSAELLKTGLGTVNMLTNNSFTGSTTVSNGTLILAGNNALGAITVNNSGTLTIAASTAAAGLVDVGTNAGNSAVLNLPAGGTLSTSGEIWLSSGTSATGTMNVNGGAANVGSWLAVGRGGNAGYLNVSSGSLVAGTAVSNANLTVGSFVGDQGHIALSGGTLQSVNSTWIGESGSGTFTQTGGLLVTGADLTVGSNAGSTGSLNITAGTMNVGHGLLVWGGTGSMTISQTGSTPTVVNSNWITLGQLSGAVGTITQNGGVVATRNDNMYLGWGAGAQGFYNLHGGSLTVADLRTDSGTGVVYQDGGNATVNGWLRMGMGASAVTSYTLAGGTLAVNGGQANVGENGTGTLTIGGSNGGMMLASSATVLSVANGSGTGTLNLQPNGLLRTPNVGQGSGAAAFNFSGGTLQNAVGGNLNVTMPVNLGGHGTVAVDGGRTATFQPLATLGGGGGLTKTGAGTMIVQSNNSYSGATVINGGVLQLGSVVPQLAYTFASGTVNAGNNPTPVTVTPVGTPVFSTTGGPNGMGTMTLDGSSYLDITSTSLPNLSGSANYTIAGWINTSQAGAAFLYKGDGNWNKYDQVFFLTGSTGNANGSAGGHVGGVQSWGGWVGGNTDVNTGTWQFVSIVRSGGTDTFYVNGVADGTATNMGLQEQGTQDIRIGFNAGDTADGANMFVGQISGAYLYNNALNAGQIVSLMNAGPNGVYGTLPSTTALSITNSGAALDLDGAQQTVASLSGVPGSSIYLGGGKLTVGNTGSTTFAGDISDLGGAGSGAGGRLVLNGSGTLTLSGTNTFSGGTTVENGTLILSNNQALLDGSSLTVGDPAAFAAPIIPSAVANSLPAAAVAPVPEPGTWALLAAAIGCALLWRRKFR